MEKDGKKPSYTAIVIWFIFFWPVGVYLLWKRVANDKTAALKNSKILNGIGIFFIFGAVVMLLSCFEDSADVSSSLVGMLFYLIGGILILYASKRVKESGERYKRYIEIVINQQQRTIENISSQVGCSYDMTVKELQEMIDKGYFSNAHIDYSNHEIVFPVKEVVSQPKDTSGQIEPERIKIVKCPNCGGNNTITVGKICECDFCGSPIE